MWNSLGKGLNVSEQRFLLSIGATFSLFTCPWAEDRGLIVEYDGVMLLSLTGGIMLGVIQSVCNSGCSWKNMFLIDFIIE